MPESIEVLVIGAGQAGLAASYWLGRHGVEHLLLDRGPASAARGRPTGTCSR